MPDFIATLDQLRATLAEIAVVLGGYRENLIAAGFDEQDALELCLEVQRQMMGRLEDHE